MAQLSEIVAGQRNTVIRSVSMSPAPPLQGGRAIQSNPYSLSSAAEFIRNSCGETPRRESESMWPTNAPRPSSRVIATVSSPTSVIRARSQVAPTAYRDTPSHSNGNLVSSDSARLPLAPMPCRTASSSAGCRPNPSRSGVCPLRYCRLDEHLAAASPRRPQAAERRTVFVSTRSQFGVHPGNVD